MLGVSTGTAEEFYSRCLANAQILERAARARIGNGDPAGALADAWGADISMLQAVMWERILVASRVPQRQFFLVAEAVVRGLRTPPSTEPPLTTLGRQVAEGRERMATAFDEALAREMAARWPDIVYLEAVPAVSWDELGAAAGHRLEGRAAAAFVEHRRREAADLLLQAQACRVRGDTPGAIQQAYAADFKGLEAYLVESAAALGDTALLTVTMRWDLAVHAVSELAGLPSDFTGAVGAIRAALAGAVGEADGQRLLDALQPV